MQARRIKSARGRPPGTTKGAKEAIASVQEYLQRENLTLDQLAVAAGVSQSSARRALYPKGTARWTPSLTKIYCSSINDSSRPTGIGGKAAPSHLLQLLRAMPPPATAAVSAILTDIQKALDELGRERIAARAIRAKTSTRGDS